MKGKISILIVDDHPTTRAGIRSILGNIPDMEIVGEAQNGDEALKLIDKLRPSVLLLDLVMPGMPAAQIEKRVRDDHPEIVTLVLTAHDRDAYLADMIDAGASGYLAKNERAENLIAAIRRAARGENLFSDEQIERARRWNSNAGKKWESLTEREREAARLLLQGMSDLAISKALGISPRTASYHVANILRKLGMHSRHEAAAWLLKYIPASWWKYQPENR